jgi:predicted enzyme related to lactoylglutathione lyase
MKLGDYVEIETVVDDVVEALAFYERHGFRQAGAGVVTDGSINLRLRDRARAGGHAGPALSYAGGDLTALEGLDGVERDGDSAILVDPNGLRIVVSERKSDVPMPAGDPLNRTPISHFGKFGEFSIPCRDRDAAIRFWEKLGFENIYAPTEPYPFAILNDGLIILGLHQTTDFSAPTITYFAGDMADRIARLKQAGLAVTDMPPEVDGRIVNATFNGPGGQPFFLFQGEI